MARSYYDTYTGYPGADYQPSYAIPTQVPQSAPAQQSFKQDYVEEQPQGSLVKFSPSTKRMSVGGQVFDMDDAAAALKSLNIQIPQPIPAEQDAGDWRDVSIDEFKGYIQRIKNPSKGRLLKKNIEIGGSNLKLLGARALQFAGAEDAGQGWVDDAVEELRKNEPYQRQFTDIKYGDDEGDGAIDWFVANFGQAIPSLMESAGAALVGAGIGTVTGGPVGTALGAVGGALAKTMGKPAVTKAMTAAAKKRLRGEQLTIGENKLLREGAAIAGVAIRHGKLAGATSAKSLTKAARRQRAAGGAAIGTLGSSYAIGVGDIYGETIDEGDPSRAKAALGAVPYAALEALPEFLLAAKLFGGIKKGSKGGILKRGTKGAAAGAVAEGLTELGQEGLVLGLGGGEHDPGKITNRLVNAFAAGFAVGGPIGGLANLKRGTPTDLMEDAGTPDVPQLEDRSARQLTYQPEEEPETPLPPFQPEPGTTLSQQETDFVRRQDAPGAGQSTDTSQTEQPIDILTLPREELPSELQDAVDVVSGEQDLAEAPKSLKKRPRESAPLSELEQLDAEQESQLDALEQFVQGMQETFDATEEIDQDIYEPGDDFTPTEEEVGFVPDEVVEQEEFIEPEQTTIPEVIDAQGTQPEAAPVDTTEQTGVVGGRIYTTEETPNKSLKKKEASAVAEERPDVQEELVVASGSEGVIGAAVDKGVLPEQALPPGDKPKSGQDTATHAELRLRFGKMFNRHPELLGNEASPETVLDAWHEFLSDQVDPPFKGNDLVDVLIHGLSQNTSSDLRRFSAVELVNVAFFAGGNVHYMARRKAQKHLADMTSLGDTQQDEVLMAFLFELLTTAETKRVASTKRKGKATATTNPWFEFAETNLMFPEETYANTSNFPTRYETKENDGTVTTAIQVEELIKKSAPNVKRVRDMMLGNRKGKGDTSLRDVPNWAAWNYYTWLSRKKGHKTSASGTASSSLVEMRSHEAIFGKPTPMTFVVRSKKEGEAKVKAYKEEHGEDAVVAYRVQTTKTTEKQLEESRQRRDNYVVDLEGQVVERSSAGKPNATDDSLGAGNPIFREGELDDDDIVVSDTDTRAAELDVLDAKIQQKYRERDVAEQQMEAETVATKKKKLEAEVRRIEKAADKLHEKRDKLAQEVEHANSDDVLLAAAEQEALNADKNFDPKGAVFRTQDSPTANPEAVNRPVNRLKARTIINRFLQGLKVRPKVYLFENQSDMRERDPKLYARFKASRPKDFDSARAMGVSLGDTVVLFRTRLPTAQSLRFTVAHEVMGHFGLRAMFTASQLKTELQHVWDSSPEVRGKAEVYMERTGAGKLEAVEEVLADYAAAVESSAILRLWEGTKNLLNKLGLELEDDAARYLMSRARKNIKADSPTVLSPATIAKNLVSFNHVANAGRYSLQESSDYIASRARGIAGSTASVDGLKSVLGIKKLLNNDTVADVSQTIANGLRYIQTENWRSRVSDGASKVYNLMSKQSAYVQEMQSRLNMMTHFTNSPSFHIPILGMVKGPTKQQRLEAGQMLAHATMHMREKISDKQLDSVGDIVDIDLNTGRVVRNEANIKKLKAMSKLTPADFKAGFTITSPLNNKKFTWKPDFEVTKNHMRAFNEQRNAMDESAIIELEAMVEGLLDLRQSAVKNFSSFLGLDGDKPTSQHIKDLNILIDVGSKIFDSNTEITEDGLVPSSDAYTKQDAYLREVQRAMWNKKKLFDWRDLLEGKSEDKTLLGIADDIQGLQQVVDALGRLNKLGISEDQAYRMKNGMGNMLELTPDIRSQEMKAKSTIGRAYVPFNRRGKWNVAIKAYTPEGRAVKMPEKYSATLPFYRVETQQQAREVTENLTSVFGEQDFTVTDREGNEVKVRFRVETSEAPSTKSVQTNISVHEFIDVARSLGLTITSKDRPKIIKALTNENSRLRKSLESKFVPGWDKDVIRSVSEHLETVTHVSGKHRYKHNMREIMQDDRLWYGDYNKLAALKQTWENAKTPSEKFLAAQRYDEYAYKYYHMAPVGAREASRLDGKPYKKNLGQGEKYREQAKATVEWYGSSNNLQHSTEDALSGPISSKLKSFTVVSMLGGSFATAIMNLHSLTTNGLTYLAEYNDSRGYGAGFGYAKAIHELTRATTSTFHKNFSDTAYLTKLTKDAGLRAQTGITKNEAEFLLEATSQGVLQAAMFNALIGSARGSVNPNMAAAVQGWMYMFTHTEQHSRRAMALASYRLERDRAISAGMSPDEAHKQATERADDAVNMSLGNYSMYNRPEIARGNLLQYVYVFKQFTVTSVQHMKGLPPRGQLLYMGMLLMAAGISGLPFAEDIMDIVSTLGQMFGIQSIANVEKELVEFLHWMHPGITPVMMHGILNATTGQNIGPRLAFGNLIPGTSLFRAGSDSSREMLEVAGPVFSGIHGALGTSWKMAQAPFTKKESVASALRSSPITMLRAATDAWAYGRDGRITNAYGRTVVKDVHYSEIVGRLLGFYSARASLQNEVVAMSKQVADYSRMLKASYVMAHTKAMLSGDRKLARQLSSEVRKHNREFRNTEYFIRGFGESASTSLKAARQSTAGRYLKTAPTTVRPYTRWLSDVYGV